MPVKHCCYGCCKSDSRYPERMIALHFIPFPKPKSQQDKCIQWIKACGRPSIQFNVGRVNKDTYICSKVRLSLSLMIISGNPSFVS